MKTLTIGDVTITSIVERDGQWRKPADMFPDYDAAKGDFFHDPRAVDVVTSRSLRGHGIGFNWSKPGQVTMNLSVAWRGTGAGLTDGGDRNPRVYWSIQKAF